MTGPALAHAAPRWCRPLLIGIGCILAWCNRFVQDDAFISFVYARNLVEGEGLTWFGERIEGYSNLLWVLWIGLGMQLGAGAIAWSYAGGLLAFAGTLWLTAKIGAEALRCGSSRESRSPHTVLALLPVVLLATNYSFSSYATGGLETMLQTLWMTAGLAMVLAARQRAMTSRRAALLSVVLSLGVLTRPDGVVPALLLGSVGLWLLRSTDWRRTAPAYLAPAIVIGATFVTWKLTYYGELLPNTYYAKAGGVAPWRNGFNYLGRFLAWYGVGPLLALGTIFALRRPDRNLGWTTTVALVAAWSAYVISVGGDFMEFRFVVPMLPAIALLVSLALVRLGAKFGHQLATVTVGVIALVGLSAFHAWRFEGTTKDQSLDSVPFLATCYGLYPDEDWSRIGAALGDALGDVDVGGRVKLAMHPVGAIPFYSRLPTVDMWGLNDAQVARHGNRVDDDFLRPGHRRHASLEYLREQNVHLLLGHPTLMRSGLLLQARTDGTLRTLLQRAVRDMVRFESNSFGEVHLVELPIRAGQSLLAVNLTRHTALDQRIRVQKWPTLDLPVE